MEKTYDADKAQQKADEIRTAMIGRRYQHYKGDRYEVTDVVVDEATGQYLVVYKSDEKGFRWSRTFTNFFETTPETGDKMRFEFVPNE